jgi:hypothetical protein
MDIDLKIIKFLNSGLPLPGYFLYDSQVRLEVFVAFEFMLHGDDVFCVADLAVVDGFEVLLELV